MLGKLIKYEWRGLYKVGLLLLGVVAFATLLGFFAAHSPLWSDIRIYDETVEAFAGMMSFGAIMIYIMLLVGVVYAVLIYVAVRFYRTMYTDEGYLLHTLPVNKNQILISKVLMGSVWVFFINVAVFASVMAFVSFIFEAVSPGSFGELMREMAEIYAEIGMELRNMDSVTKMRVVHLLISMTGYVVLGLPSTLVTIFGAISLGQLFSKHRVLMAILSYVGINIGINIVSALLRTLTYTSSLLLDVDEVWGYVITSIDTALLVNVLIAVGFYMLSYYITSRKLNME